VLRAFCCLSWETAKRSRLGLTQVDRCRHSVSDVVEYVATEKVARICFQNTSCIHTPVGNSNTLGLYLLIISYCEAFFFKEIMNISDSLHKLSILAIINRTRVQDTEILSGLLYLKSELLS
jgi:hypothetical protein